MRTFKIPLIRELVTTAILVVLLSQSVYVYATSSQLNLVNPLIGNTGPSPNDCGGMIPSVSPPFGTTRWVAQTTENYVSKLPYNYSDSAYIHGFIGTRQPAIWMGESGSVVVVPGVGHIKHKFGDRGLSKVNQTEKFAVGLYSVQLEADDNSAIDVEMTATSHVGYLRFTFSRNDSSSPSVRPYILVQSSRPVILYSVPAFNVNGNLLTIYPDGQATINPSRQEICGYNTERQDVIITPVSTNSSSNNFKGYFCARFSRPFDDFGIVQGSEAVQSGQLTGEGPELASYAYFDYPEGETSFTVELRVGTSFISIDQARQNIDDDLSHDIESTRKAVDEAWLEKLGRVELEGGTSDNQTVFMTGVFHALQYPHEQDESGRYYSAYDDTVHNGQSYTGYSIWDTFRAEWAFLILMAPERIPGMIQSMLQDYQQSGWLPMWKNIAETNIMVGTHADSQIAEAVIKGITGFDLDLAWEAVWKDVTQAPVNDSMVSYFDREEGVDYEARAGLSSVYAEKGWVANDLHSESASRTLDYAYDDFAAAQFAIALDKSQDIIDLLLNRSLAAPFTLYNEETGFMEARNADGSWAGANEGWTEGDKWAYSFDVVHDIPGLIQVRGGNASFVQSLEDHFNGGHNDHTNEPSHHIPYLYALAGAPAKAQERIREIAQVNYNNTPGGLAGNEDCGQMSAWFIFSAMGFYPVNPVSGEYIVGSPFFDKVTLHLPSIPSDINVSSPYYNKQTNSYTLTVSSPGAPTKVYVKSLTVNGRSIDQPIIRHEDIKYGGDIIFEMSETVQPWAGGLGSLQVTSKVKDEYGHDEL